MGAKRGFDNDFVDVSVRLPRGLVEEIFSQTAATQPDDPRHRITFAKWILASRRRRSKVLDGLRFGEPTWDMILDLYIADSEDRQIDVSSLCLASGIAPTTALRYVDILIDDGLIAKVDDSADGRRSFIILSEYLRQGIENWLDQALTGLAIAGWTVHSAPAPDPD